MRSMHRLATAALALALAGPAAAQRPAPVPRPGPAPRPAACCDVVGIDARTGVVSAKVNASDEVFEFKVADARTLNALRVGQRVHADFARKEVSLDGRTPCCTITSGPQGAAVARAPVRPPLTTDRAGGGGALLPAAGARLGGAPLPRVSYGEPIPASAAEPVARAAARFATRTVTARQGGRDLSATVLVVGGRVGMKQVPADALPDGARRLLEMHARTLRRDESGYYIVDPAAAREWAKTHAVPDHIKPKEEEKKDDSECGDKWSMNAAQDCVQDAGDAVAAEWERARERAEQWWKGSTSELADLWGETASCFTERTLPGGRAPVKFAITPSMTVDMQQSGSKGAADGAIKGVVRLGIPIEADFEAAVARVREPAKRLEATQFEIVTAAAFQAFADARVDAAVVEAGLGGRYDATNVLRTRVVLLTNVGLEHTDVLGDTLEQIATEKLAVAPSGAIVVLPDRTYEHLVPGCKVILGGAREAAEAFAGHRIDARPSVSLPGRLERRPGEIRDGAHNPDGARHLVEQLDGDDHTIVASILADKDVGGMLRILRRAGPRFVATRSSSHRALPARELADRARGYFDQVEAVDDPVAAVVRAHELGEPVLVTGSLYLVGDLAQAER